MQQATLFDLPSSLPPGAPPGLLYEPDFLSPSEEAGLIALVQRLPLEAARYKAYTARRRTVSYGGSFDYDANRLLPAEPLIEALHPLREKVAEWAGLPASALVHALVAEYAPATPLGWHRDVPDFEEVIGISLGSEAVLRFRPYAASVHKNPGAAVRRRAKDVIRLTVAPRSIYLLRGEARWAWQHSVAPVDALRWSITFRTKAAASRRR